MSSETKKVLEDAYIADGAYCGCKQGQYIQPVTATHSDTVKMQGLKIMTCDDNVLMKNVIDFGMCNFYGDCKLKESIGQKINWENYKNDVKIKGSKALNGASYFRCPYAPTEIINFYDPDEFLEYADINIKHNNTLLDGVKTGKFEEIIVDGKVKYKDLKTGDIKSLRPNTKNSDLHGELDSTKSLNELIGIKNGKLEYDLKFGKDYPSYPTEKVVCGFCESSLPNYLYYSGANSAFLGGEVIKDKFWIRPNKASNNKLKLKTLKK